MNATMNTLTIDNAINENQETPMMNIEASSEMGDILSERELFKLVQNLPQGKSLLDVCREVAEAKEFLVRRRMEIEAMLHAPELPALSDADGEKREKKKLPPRSLEELKKEFSLVFDPKQALQTDKVVCCLCGKEVQSLTSRHLNMHGISVEEYKLLCGYEPDTILMSTVRYENAQHAIVAAQSARKSGDASAAEATDDAKEATGKKAKSEAGKKEEVKSETGKKEDSKKTAAAVSSKEEAPTPVATA